MKKKSITYFKYSATILFAMGLLFIHFFVPRVITEIRNPVIEILRGQHQITTRPTFDNSPKIGREIRYSSFDKTELVAFESFSKLNTCLGTIILLHGIRSRKEHFISLSQNLTEDGFNTIALDLRGHGESGGSHCTFGVNEKKDIIALIDILKLENPSQKIGIFGQSLGGAVALQTLGSDDRLSFGVIESTFSDFRTIAHDYIKFHLGFNLKFFSNYLVYRAGKIASFDTDDASPIRYCKKITQPIFMVHGSNDKRINIKYGLANFNAITHEKGEFLEMKNANHLNVWKIGGNKYIENVIEFMKTEI